MTTLSTHLPNALDRLDDIRRLAAQKPLALFLDYDGTLTPIVSRPEDAHLPDGMRTTLARLARRRPVAIVSGRDLVDVRQRVGLDALYYAGSHGFEIAGPDGLHTIYTPAEAFLPALDQAEDDLRQSLAGIPGAQVERKRFAIAVHYRRVDPDRVDTVNRLVSQVHRSHPRLRQTGGKMIWELRPDLDWNKGTALFWLLDAMGLTVDRILPLYMGDDDTDEDAFAALHDHGLGVLVMDDTERPTAARYVLPHVPAVQTFLDALVPPETPGP